MSLPFGALNMLVCSGVWYGMGSMRPGAASFAKFYCILTLLYLNGVQVIRILQQSSTLTIA